jgi:hypothetical protein
MVGWLVFEFSDLLANRELRCRASWIAVARFRTGSLLLRRTGCSHIDRRTKFNSLFFGETKDGLNYGSY